MPTAKNGLRILNLHGLHSQKHGKKGRFFKCSFAEVIPKKVYEQKEVGTFMESTEFEAVIKRQFK